MFIKIILFIICALLVFFAFGYFFVQYNRKKIIEELRTNSYDIFGDYTSYLEYEPAFNESGNTFDKGAIILLNNDNGTILIGGKIFNLSDIIICEPYITNDQYISSYEERTIIDSNTSQTIKRAAVGALVAGGVGAVVGATTTPKEIRHEMKETRELKKGSYRIQIKTKKHLNSIIPDVYTISDDNVTYICSFINTAISIYNNKMKTSSNHKTTTQTNISNDNLNIPSHNKPMQLLENQEPLNMDQEDTINHSKEINMLLKTALLCISANKNISTSSLARTLGIEYERANEILAQLEASGVVGKSENGIRSVLITQEDIKNLL